MRLAIGAREAAIEVEWAGFALVLALEQRPLAALVAPADARLGGVDVEQHPVAVDAVDLGAAQRVVDAARVRVRLGEDQPVAGHPVDGPDMLAVVADDLHMLADLAEHLAFALAAFAPAAEVVLELRLMLAAILLIVAVELVELPLAPLLVVRVVLRPVAGKAGAAIFVAAPGAFAVRAAARLAAGIAAAGEPVFRPAVIARDRAIAAVLAVARAPRLALARRPERAIVVALEAATVAAHRAAGLIVAAIVVAAAHLFVAVA